MKIAIIFKPVKGFIRSLGAPALAGSAIFVTLVGLAALERGHIGLAIVLLPTGLLALGAAKDLDVERAKGEAIMRTLKTLVDGDGTDIRVTHYEGAQSIEIEKDRAHV